MRPSAKVEAFDALCEVQSDKASVEITSPFDGVIHQLIVKEGEIAKVGEKLCLIEVEEEDGTDDAPAAISSASASNSLELSKSTTLPAAETSEALTESTITPPVDVPKEERGRHPMDPDFIPKASSSDGAVLATPSVRHFARQNKVDLAAVGPGTGREGRIEKKDVERYMAGGAATAEKTSSSGGASQAMSQPHSAEEVTVEMGRTRSAMWKSMTRVRIPCYATLKAAHGASITEFGNSTLWVRQNISIMVYDG